MSKVLLFIKSAIIMYLFVILSS